MATTRREFLKTAGVTLVASGMVMSGLNEAAAQSGSVIRIKGKAIVPGVVKGEALVSSMPISFTGGMNPQTGVIREKGHVLLGQSVAGKILVFPQGKGSTTGSWQFWVAYKKGKAPIGLINVKAEGIVTCSAVITNTPMIHLLEKNPLEMIRTGDMVTINGNEGWIEVVRA
ncbi:MAG TPA: DUF126 domain-containing protein [Syntrophorhabdaceae bacterium]